MTGISAPMSPLVLRTSSMLAGCLLAASVAGQEPVQDDYEAACESLSGNARSDETVCIGVNISDGMNDISAGLAATNKFDFDSSRWRLSESVRLAFNTTEILADEALFEFEADELVLAQLGIGRSQPGHGDPWARAGHVVQPGTVAKADRRRMAALLTADADLEVRPY